MEQEQVIIRLDLLADRKLAQFTVGPACVKLTAEQVDEFVAALGGIRAQMMPSVPEEFPQGKPTHQHRATKFSFGISAADACPVLAVRSEAFGWLVYGFSFEDAERLGRQMQEARKNPMVPNMSKPN